MVSRMATGTSARMFQWSGMRNVRFVSHISSPHQAQSSRTPIQG